MTQLKIKQRNQSVLYNISIGVKILMHGLRPSAIIGRGNAPKILINSIPKSGTNLIGNALWHTPYLRRFLGKTVTIGTPNRIYTSLRNIKNGQYIFSHLPWDESIEKVINIHNIKVLFMIRDPRDIVVSRFKYITYIDLNHRAHKYFINLPNDRERLMYAIKGKNKIIKPINIILHEYYNWLNNNNCKIIKFEDLVGLNGGASIDQQIVTIKKIIEFLNISINEAQIKLIAKNTFSTKSPTFSTGQKNTWKKYFTEEHNHEFNKTSSEMLIKYGYTLK